MRRASAIYIVFGLIVLTIAFAGFMSIRSLTRMDDLNDQWQNYYLIAQEKGTVLGDLKEAVGYVGFIHNFKNFVIRGTGQFFDASVEDYTEATVLVGLYESYDLSPPEISALEEIRRTLDAYRGNLDVARQMKSEGASIQAIDGAIKVDDQPMQTALETLKSHWLSTYSDGLNNLDQMLTESEEEAFVWLFSLGLSFLAMLIALYTAVRFQRSLVDAREKLTATNTRLHTILENSADPVIILGADGMIESCNIAFSDMMGFKVGDLLGKHISALQVKSGEQDWHAIINSKKDPSKRAQPKTIILDLRTKDGRELAAELNVSTFRTETESGFIATMRDVTERQRTEMALIQAKLESEEALASSQSYFANISHELRTPLNAILGFSQVLMRDDLPKKTGPEQSQEYASYIHTAGEHLLKLVDEVLDISKIRDGNFTLRKEDVQVDQVLSEALTLARRLATDKGVRLEEDLQCTGIGAQWDIMRMVQVLLNILSNAIKFTEPGGLVTISCATQDTDIGQQIIIVISDTGPGIPAHEIKNVFRPFVQASHTVSDLGAGTGLGLPLAKFLVDLHGGEISLTSKPDKGTTVIITMPL